MKIKMNGVLAGAFNMAMETIGVAWRIEQITPEQAEKTIAENPALLKKYDLSQKMSGDKDDQVADKKGRPMTDHLARRMANDEWKWYISIMYRLSNGGVTDGLTRLLSCVQSQVPFWTMVYIAAEPEDFMFFDELQSSRSNKDFVLNGNVDIKPAQAGIEAQFLPKAFLSLESDDETSHTQIVADQFLTVKEKHPEAVQAAVQFVSKSMPRKAMIALVHFEHVGGPDAKNPEAAERLLTAYVTGLASNANEKEMTELRQEVRHNTNSLHERNIRPALKLALGAAEEGLKFKFSYPKSKGKVVSVDCEVKRPRRKSKAAGV